MSDPLSIAASIAGLVTLAGTIYTSLTSFIDRFQNAPGFVRTILMEVSITRMTLSHMSDLIDKFLELPPARRAMVHLDHLILTVTHAVMAFSDLEGFLSGWPAITKVIYSPLQKIRWALQDDKAQRLITQLRDTRNGLSLVLNIFGCISEFGAMQARDTLQITLDRLLKDNEELRASLMGPKAGGPTVNGPSIRPASSHVPSRVGSILQSRRASLMFSHPFETILNSTRVYTRVQNNDCDNSLHTDVVASHWGSTYTGLTLDRVSVISVILLPLPMSSIVNTQWYTRSVSSDTVTITETGLLTPTSTPPSPLSPVSLGTPMTSISSIPAVTKHKIVMLGEPFTGKSSLAMRFSQGRYYDDTEPTIEDTYYKRILLNGQFHDLEVIDTSGALEYEGLRKLSIVDADGIMIVYAVHRARDFDGVARIYATLVATIGEESLPPIVLVGTGLDTGYPRKVSTSDGFELAKRLGCGFYECSARDNIKVEDPFLHLVKRSRSTKEDTPELKLLGWENM